MQVELDMNSVDFMDFAMNMDFNQLHLFLTNDQLKCKNED